MPETEFASAPTTAAVPSHGAPAYPSYPQPAQGPQPVQAPAPYGAPVPGAVPAPHHRRDQRRGQRVLSLGRGVPRTGVTTR
ncbi:hypothetical protein [Rhodococcus sp. NPDC127528]|uniref:hypothetical protein n=1 Tax=unclassified Rhodococcus (in: high G+C Gram-positive bacteria) TaxID=192944 RepID=UPI00362DB5DB